MRATVPDSDSMAMRAVLLDSISASFPFRGFVAAILEAPPAFTNVTPASGVSIESEATPLVSSCVTPEAGTQTVSSAFCTETSVIPMESFPLSTAIFT